MDDKQYTEEVVKNINRKLKTKQAALKFDNTPTTGSVNPVTSEGIKEYVDSHQGKTYTAGNGVEIKDNNIQIDTDVVATKNDLLNYVTVNTDQTITGDKLFEDRIQIRDSQDHDHGWIGLDINRGSHNLSSDAYLSLISSASDNIALYGSGQLHFFNNGGKAEGADFIFKLRTSGNGSTSYYLPNPYTNTDDVYTIATTDDIPVYTAGTNVAINNNVISATDTTYSAGENVAINNNNVISSYQRIAASNIESRKLGANYGRRLFSPGRGMDRKTSGYQFITMNYYRIWRSGSGKYYYSDYENSQMCHYVLTSGPAWDPITMTAAPNDFNSNYTWTLGSNTYYTSGGVTYSFNEDTLTWSVDSSVTPPESNYVQNWNFWSDGIDLYYNNKVLNSSGNWVNKTWASGPENGVSGIGIWTDGNNIYYSSISGQLQYVLNKAANSWEEKDWGGIYPDGRYIFTDGKDIYYLPGTYNKYILNKSSLKWEVFNWGSTSYNSYQYMWTVDGKTYVLKYNGSVCEMGSRLNSNVTAEPPIEIEKHKIHQHHITLTREDASQNTILKITFNIINHMEEKFVSLPAIYNKNFSRNLGLRGWLQDTSTGNNSLVLDGQLQSYNTSIILVLEILKNDFTTGTYQISYAEFSDIIIEDQVD